MRGGREGVGGSSAVVVDVSDGEGDSHGGASEMSHFFLILHRGRPCLGSRRQNRGRGCFCRLGQVTVAEKAGRIPVAVLRTLRKRRNRAIGLTISSDARQKKATRETTSQVTKIFVSPNVDMLTCRCT